MTASHALRASALLLALAPSACRNESARQTPRVAPAPPPGPGTPPTQADAGREGATCTGDATCGFGLVCTGGRCAPSGCHDGMPMVPPRICPNGQFCNFANREAARNGRGTCSSTPNVQPGDFPAPAAAAAPDAG